MTPSRLRGLLRVLAAEVDNGPPSSSTSDAGREGMAEVRSAHALGGKAVIYRRQRPVATTVAVDGVRRRVYLNRQHYMLAQLDEQVAARAASGSSSGSGSSSATADIGSSGGNVTGAEYYYLLGIENRGGSGLYARAALSGLLFLLVPLFVCWIMFFRTR